MIYVDYATLAVSYFKILSKLVSYFALYDLYIKTTPKQSNVSYEILLNAFNRCVNTKARDCLALFIINYNYI